MDAELLPYLRCPSCHAHLTAASIGISDDGEIVAGELRCGICNAVYTVRDGILDLLGAARPASPAQAVNDWPLTAWGYERLWRPFALTLFSGEPFPYRRELALIVALAAPWRGGLYLDLACSNGLYARALARTRYGTRGHVVGVDRSLPMLAQARRYARAAGLRISFVRAEAQALPLAAGVVAGVTIGGSLNEIGDLDGCLAQVRRVLARDGRFVAMTLTRATTHVGRALQALAGRGGIGFWAPDQLEQAFARHSLRTIGHWQYGAVLFTLCVPRSEDPLLTAGTAGR